MKFTFTLLLLACGFSAGLKAQSDSAAMAVQMKKKQLEKRLENAPYFSYKNGLGFSTPDSSYSMNIRFRIQERALMTTASDNDLSPETFEMRTRRCRLSFTGHMYNTKWSYYLQLSFSRGDMDWTVTDASTQNVSPNVLRDAMVFYKPLKHLTLGFGQGKLPGNRQRVVSSGSLQFYDRSPVNANFTLDRDFGFFGTYTAKVGKTITLFKAALTSGEGRNSNISNAGLAYTGRVEFLPLGEFTDNGDYFEGDVVREQKPKLSLAGGYHLNDMAVRTQGQLGRDLFSPRTYQVYLADVLFKYKGFAISSEYMMRQANTSAITTSSVTAGRTVSLLTGNGVNTQLSYCFKSKYEVALRYSVVSPDKEVYSSFKQNKQYGIGVTKYIMRHKLKTQFNIFYNQDNDLKNIKETRNLFAVFQIEMGI